MSTNITKQKMRRINGFSHHEIGDDHLYTWQWYNYQI